MKQSPGEIRVVVEDDDDDDAAASWLSAVNDRSVVDAFYKGEEE